MKLPILYLLLLLIFSCEDMNSNVTTSSEFKTLIPEVNLPEKTDLDSAEFVSIISDFIDIHSDHLLSQLSKEEHISLIRIHNTFCSHLHQRIPENRRHSLCDSLDRKNFLECSFNLNFEYSLLAIYPVQLPSSGIHFKELDLTLYRGCDDNYNLHCPNINFID